MMEGEAEGEMTGKEAKETAKWRAEKTRKKTCRETWDMTVFCFAGTACSLHSSCVQSKQASQTTVSTSEKKRDVETERRMRETCRQTDGQSFYPLMCLMVPFDSKVYYRVLSLKPGPCLSVLTNWTWWLKCCGSGLTNFLSSVLLKFILHSNHWILSIFPSCFSVTGKWSFAVIRSISCLSGRCSDSFMVTDEVTLVMVHCSPELGLCFFQMHSEFCFLLK